jgi:hypothetical protein
MSGSCSAVETLALALRFGPCLTSWTGCRNKLLIFKTPGWAGEQGGHSPANSLLSAKCLCLGKSSHRRAGYTGIRVSALTWSRGEGRK